MLENADNAVASFTPNVEGVFVFALRVLDEPMHEESYGMKRWSPSCLTQVQALAALEPPVAVVASRINALVGTLVCLDGTGSHSADGSLLAFGWRQQRGAPVLLRRAGSATPCFAACSPGLYVFELSVHAGRTESLPAEVLVGVADSCNRAPVSDAGDDTSVELPGWPPAGEVQLDGSRSRDDDGDTLEYKWTQTGGFPVHLGPLDDAKPSCFPPSWGEYSFKLEVGDRRSRSGDTAEECWRQAWSFPDEVRITVVSSD